jgi:hypothetical protein
VYYGLNGQNLAPQVTLVIIATTWLLYKQSSVELELTATQLSLQVRVCPENNPAARPATLQRTSMVRISRSEWLVEHFYLLFYSTARCFRFRVFNFQSKLMEFTVFKAISDGTARKELELCILSAVLCE